MTAWNKSTSVVGSSALEGCADENTIVPPDPSTAGATLGVHHSVPEEPLMRATQRVTRSNAYTSGRRFVSLPARGHPGPDPRFDARDWYATTSPSSESAGLRLSALADWPLDVMLTSVVVCAATSKMYTSRSLFRSLRSRAASDSNATYRPSALSAGKALAPFCAPATPPPTSRVMAWRTSRTYTSATVFVSAAASRAVETKATTAPSRLTRGER